MVEVIVVGMVVTLFLLQVIIGYGRLSVAGDAATAAAQTAALWAARSGTAADAATMAAELAPGTTVESWQDGGTIHVVVRRAVSVIGPAVGPLQYTVVGRGSAIISPYRSDG